MRSWILTLVLSLGSALPVASQVVAPSLGTAGRTGHPAVELQGLPGAWVAVPAQEEATDSAASSSAQRCWVRNGELSILQLKTGAVHRFPVANGGAQFAFNSDGELAAILASRSGEVYTAAANWAAVYFLPSAIESLDLRVASDGVITVLYRARRGLHRVRVDGRTGQAISDVQFEDRRGPALLDAQGQPIFAVDSGLTGVTAMQRVEQGWTLLSTPHSLWLWQQGRQPQGVPVSATAAPTLQVWPFNSSQDVGDTIAFPDTAPGYITKLQFLIVNSGVSDVDISTVHLTSAAPFSIFAHPSVPWTLQAGKFATLGIQFAPSASGSFSGSLTLNERSITLTGNATGDAAPLQPKVTLSQTQLTSNATAQVGVKLNQKAAAEQTGLLSLTFTPASASAPDDPAIQLTGNQQVTRSQPFRVPAGSDTALFGTDSFVTLATGTTAGSLTLNAALGSGKDSKTIVVAPAAPSITSAIRQTTAGGIVLTFQGFDNTRSVSGLTFTFYTGTGAQVSPGAIAVDVSQDFGKYFQANPQIGGNFQVTATFPVSGDIAAIASTSVLFKNSVGTSSATP